MPRRIDCLLLVAFSTFGCAGRVLDIGAGGDAGQGGQNSFSSGGASSSSSSSSGGSSGAVVDSGSSATGERVYPAGSPAALAQAACANPTHGSVVPYADQASFSALLIGRWYSCTHGNNLGSLPLFTRDGIEFSADGTFHALAADASGNFSQVEGIDNSGTWPLVPPPSGTQLNITFADGTFLPDHPAFEQDPRRVRMDYFPDVIIWMVPL